MTKIYYTTLEGLKDPVTFEKYYNEMSSARKSKIDRLRGQEQKRQSLGAGILVKYAFAAEKAQDDFTARKPEVQISEVGCSAGIENIADSGCRDVLEMYDTLPYGTPICGMYVSLSHSGNVAMCAISSHPVGCDVEQLSDKDEKVAKRALTTVQYEKYLAMQNRDEQRELFFKVWTAKECVIKAEGGNVTAGDIEVAETFAADRKTETNHVASMDREKRQCNDEFGKVPSRDCAVAKIKGTEKAYNIRYYENPLCRDYVFACCSMADDLDIEMKEVRM